MPAWTGPFHSAYGVFVSGGVERQLLVWRADSRQCVGELEGHGASVIGVHCDDVTCQVPGMICVYGVVYRCWRWDMHERKPEHKTD